MQFENAFPILYIYSYGKISLGLREFWIIRGLQQRILRMNFDNTVFSHIVKFYVKTKKITDILYT